MKSSFLLATFLAVIFVGKAQVYDKKVVHTNDNLSDHFTYRFPSFEEATVLFKAGGSLKSKMNFNTLLSTMQFIDPKGDTLELSKLEEIDSIFFKNSTFYFNKGYFEILAANAGVRLVVLRTSKFEPVKIGAMGLPTRTGGVENVDAYSSNAKYMKALRLSVNEDINVLEKTEYFLLAKDQLIKAGKAGFLRTFNNENGRIDQFLKSNKINFNDPGDLRKLFDFCAKT